MILPIEVTDGFENYTAVSSVYDDTRGTVGVEAICAGFARRPEGLAAMDILDLGCGTGNYTTALGPQVASVVGLDLNRGMLASAVAKGDGTATAGLVQASAMALPFAGGSFDGVTCNHVLHHLETAETLPGLLNLQVLAREVARVLRPGGMFCLQTVTPEQHEQGYWWSVLIPDATTRLVIRLPSVERIRALLVQAGLTVVDVQVPKDEILQGASYLDPEGPLKDAWRLGDSTWSLAAPAELEEAQERVRTHLAEGTMAGFLALRERSRKEVGQTTIIIAEKGGA